MDETTERIPTREEIEAALSDDEPTEDPLLSVLSTPQEKEIGAKILPGIAARVRQTAEAESAKKLSERVKELEASNMRMIEDEVKKIRENLKPPDGTQLEKLLSQEYGTMNVTVPSRKGEHRTFVLRELPQDAEKRMLAIVTKNLMPHLKALASVEWAAASTQADKLQKVIEIMPDGLDMMAECCSICLDPYGDDGITKDWVQKNMGSNRIVTVIEAQLEISKLRDFGSAVYRLLPRS